jgi:TPR repeat protein
MALRFQQTDEVDREVTEKQRATSFWWIIGVGLLLYLASKVLPSEFARPIVELIAVLYALWFLSWMVSPVYHEFRSRTKEINGKVSAIEAAANASKEDHVELLEKLTAIEKQTDSKTKQISKRLAAIESALNARTDGREENPVIEDETAEEDDDVDAEGEAALVAKYRESANRGESWGQHNLGIAYGWGKGVPEDRVMATFWFRKAAEQGDESAQLNLAGICARVGGLPPDYAEALHWYTKLSEGNTFNNIAEYELGEMYADGRGVPKDYAEAARWWHKAAEHGSTWAHYKLGKQYAEGAEGVPQDYGEAYFRLYIAVGGKGLSSMQKRAIDERNELANHLTPETLSQAQERAQQWLAAHPVKA